MPSLYGNQPQQGGLYGDTGEEFLSSRNQAQAKQIGLPEATGGEHGAAGSQIEANDPFANFEDIFNLNRGYAQKEAQATSDKVKETAGEQSQLDPGTFDAGFAPKAPGEPQVNTQRPGHKPGAQPAPQPVDMIRQQPTLNGMQAAADASPTGAQGGGLLNGYGEAEEPVLQQYTPAGGPTQLGSTPPAEAPVSYQQEDTAAPPAPLSDAEDRRDPMDDDNNGTVSPEERARHEANGTAPLDTSAQDAKAKEARDAAAGLNPEYTDEELAQSGRLHKTNDLLTGWGDDMGQGILQDIYGPEASMWDAAIMNTGGGATARDDLNAKYKGKDKEYDAKIAADLAQRRKEKGAALTQAGLFEDKSNEMRNAPPPVKDTGPGTWAPEGYTSGMDFLLKESAEDVAHEAGTSISPLDALLREIPGGTKGPTDYGNDYYSGQFGTPGAKTGELRAGLGKVYDGWGQDAIDYWFSHLTPEMWQTYMSMNRATAAKAIEDWLNSTGGTPPATKGGQWTPPPKAGA